MILVVNVNLAIDYLLEVRGLVVGEVHRASAARRQAGGKGVNAMRVLKALGEPCVVAGFVGGPAGRTIANGLAEEGIPLAATRIRGESRTCAILVDPESRLQTVVNEPGPEIEPDEVERLLRRVARIARDAEIVVVTGSLPPSVDPSLYGRIVDTAQGAGRKVLVDCTGVALDAALSARPFFVKINGEEAAACTGEPATTHEGAARATARLRELGAEHAMVTIGARGASLRFRDSALRVEPPRVEVKNAVGSGDACMAGLAAGVRRALRDAELARLAVGAGAASAMHGFGRCTEAEILDVARRVRVTRVRE